MALKDPLIWSCAASGLSSDSILLHGPFSLSIEIQGTQTIVVERYSEPLKKWCTVSTYTVSSEEEGEDATGHLYRFRCTSFTSEEARCVLEQ